MEIKRRYCEDITIIDILHDLHPEDADEFSNLIISLLKDDRLKVIINFEKANYICSFILGILVWALKKLRERGGNLKLLNINSWLKTLLYTARLSEIIDCYNSEEEAINSFS